MKDPPVAGLNPPNHAEQSFSVLKDLNDASLVSAPREVIVYFRHLSRYAVTPRLILGMPDY